MIPNMTLDNVVTLCILAMFIMTIIFYDKYWRNK